LQTFKKEERLHEKKIIEQLFDKGLSFYLNPYKVIFDDAVFEGNYPAKVMITVSARNFKKAVDRNRIKRLIREAYRKNKQILYDALENHSKKMGVIIIYTGKVMISCSDVESKIILILQRLVKENEENPE
jgi:ribonuclease P protein component